MQLQLKLKTINSFIFLAFIACCGTQFTEAKVKPPVLPSSLEFAGEKVPMDDPDVRERLERELIVNQNYHSSTMLIFKQLGRYKSYIIKTLNENGVPEDFLYLAAAESALNPNATSSAGAAGIWQFISETGEMMGLEISKSVDERRHLVKSTAAACRYLKDAHREFGSWTMAAAAYNRGNKGMKDAVNSQREKDYYKLYLNQETYRYVFRILALKLILSNSENYGYSLSDRDQYKEYNYKKVTLKESVSSLPDFAISNGITYKELIYHNPWIRTGKYSFDPPGNRTYEVLIPEK